MDMNAEESAVRRSLQRALKSLESQKKIEPKGQARARIYFISKKPAVKTQAETKSVTSAFKDIKLSKDGEKLLKHISQPITKRESVGYNQKFLETYIPNKSSFLSPEQKDELITLGQVEPYQKPAGTYARDIYQRLIIDLSWNSSCFEGNTYSLLETKRLIELGEAADGKNATEAQMILNHKAAI